MTAGRRFTARLTTQRNALQGQIPTELGFLTSLGKSSSLTTFQIPLAHERVRAVPFPHGFPWRMPFRQTMLLPFCGNSNTHHVSLSNERTNERPTAT